MTAPGSASRRSVGAALRDGERVDPWIVALLVFVNGVVLLNALRHDPTIGYDADSHVAYVRTLADGRLPSYWDTTEFFSPPLPYLVPAALLRAGLGEPAALRGALLAQAAVSVLLTFAVLRLAARVAAGVAVRRGALALLAMLPVYYKSFAFVRGEPYAACLVALVLDHALGTLALARISLGRVVALGALGGLALLSRQWAAAALPAVALLALQRARAEPALARERLGSVVAALVLAAQLGGWFYVYLHVRSGSAIAFNRGHAPSFSLANQPADFYAGGGSGRLFTEPLRPAFPNQLGPILLSEAWGDYWYYWTVWGRDLADGRWVSGPELEGRLLAGEAAETLATNRGDVAAYLGRVNLAALLPTLLALVVLAAGTRAALVSVARPSGDPDHGATFVLAVTILGTLAGYGWFLMMYPNPGKGDTIKATYLLQVFPLWAVLGAAFAERLRHRWRSVWIAMVSVLALVFVHALPVLVSRYAGR